MKRHDITDLQDIYKITLDMSWFFDNVFFVLPHNIVDMILSLVNVRNADVMLDFVSAYINFIDDFIEYSQDYEHASKMVYLLEACNVFTSVMSHCVNDCCAHPSKYDKNLHPIWNTKITSTLLEMLKDARRNCISIARLEHIPEGLIGTSFKNESVLQKWYLKLVYGFDKDVFIGSRGGVYYVNSRTNKKIYLSRQT
jgi:hypothetical protein